MAAAFYYYPNSTGAVVKIELNRPIVDRPGPFQQMQQSTTQAFSGFIATVQTGGPERVTIKHRWGGTDDDDREVRRKLVAMMNHLRRGGRVLFTEDDTKTYAAFVQVYPAVDGQFLSVFLPFTDELLTGVDVDDQEIVLRSCAPDVLIEACRVTSQTGSGIVLADPIVLDFTTQAWVLLRNWGTWPALRLPMDRRSSDLMTHDHEIAFGLDLELEEDEYTLNALAIAGAPLADGVGSGTTIEPEPPNPPPSGGPGTGTGTGSGSGPGFPGPGGFT